MNKPAAKKICHHDVRTTYQSAGTVFNADVIPGASIRIYGTQTNHINGPQTFDRTFNVGDVVEYDSFNLSYMGPVLAVGAKTIMVKCGIYKKARRMTLAQFCSRNWNLDLAQNTRRNSEWMD
jgi:hypothetical protein